MIERAWSTVYRVAAQAIRPRPKPDIAEWAEKNMRYAETDAAPRYIIEKSPYARVVFKWWHDGKIEQIFLIWPTQAGKTNTLTVLTTYAAANDPGPMIFAGAEEEPTKGFLKRRFRPVVEKSLPKNTRFVWNEEHGSFVGSMFIWPAWGTSEARLRSWPCRYVVCDETSLWTQSRRLAWERTKQFSQNRKAIYCTTPTGEHEASWIDATTEFQLHRWSVPCPHCGTFQILEFARLKFDHCKKENGQWDYARVESETYYPCEACEKPITEKHRNRMIQNGVEVAVNDGDPKKKSLRITCMEVPSITWGQTARAFLDAKHSSDPDALKTFVNSWLTEPWINLQEGVKSRAVLSRTMELEAGIVPEDATALGCGVDVQRGHVYAVVRAWLKDGRSTLVWCGHIDGRPEQNPDEKRKLTEEELLASTDVALARLYERVLARVWPWENHDTGAKIRFCAIDNGDGVTKDRVDQFAYDHYGLIFLCKGDTRVSDFSVSALSRDPSGKALPGTLYFYRVNSDVYRAKIIDAYRQSMKEAGSWLVNRGIPSMYGAHLESWQQMKVQVKDRRGHVKKITYEWRKVSTAGADHYLDAEIYVAALKSNYPMLDIIAVIDETKKTEKSTGATWRGPGLPPGHKRHERF